MVVTVQSRGPLPAVAGTRAPGGSGLLLRRAGRNVEDRYRPLRVPTHRLGVVFYCAGVDWQRISGVIVTVQSRGPLLAVAAIDAKAGSGLLLRRAGRKHRTAYQPLRPIGRSGWDVVL